ncbi:phosphoethanolamine--lipid A transferase EptA [Bergeyella zoohelcum]|uniref:phosphoethanolamine--lipid A transferase EptA n=1 Tax=Bergeyella zoohelcum TaxID=1015 RepID=UPI0037356AA9
MLTKWTGRLPLNKFILIISIMNFLFFHYGFFDFVLKNIDYTSFLGLLMVISLLILMVLANFFAFYLVLFLTRFLGKILLSVTFILSAVSVYFINTYGVIVDESMIGNVFNTNYDESSSYFSIKWMLYVLLMGILPSVFIFKTKIDYPRPKRFFKTLGVTFLPILLIVALNAKNILWIDNHSKYLGGLAMPWAYSVNTALYFTHKAQENRTEIPLPDAQIADDEKSVMVLVIGESARSQNFSLYGYSKNTNPLLSQVQGLRHFPATSCATYTTAGVQCILSHENSGELYEILPNYLHRSGVNVIWRTTNTGEPPVKIEKYQNGDVLKQKCQGEACDYDEILLTQLREEILHSDKKKTLIILHTSTSHGPQYSKKYPASFQKFSPVCNSVELGNCAQEELINAYDNTIVYTDYLLHKIITELQSLEGYTSSMIFVSDHGESLGEKNLYMHGLPMTLAPKEQYEIPFIVWTSEGAKPIIPTTPLTQNHVFHSVLDFLSIRSAVFKKEMSVYK